MMDAQYAMRPRNERLSRFLSLTSSDRADESLIELLARLADGESISQVCAAWDVPYHRVMSWLMGDDARWASYKRALEVDGHRRVAEAIEIADSATPDMVSVAKLQVDVRLKIAAAHARDIYGATQQVNVRAVISRKASEMSDDELMAAIDVTPTPTSDHAGNSAPI